MRVLFIARHFTYFRNFDGAIAVAAGRGHTLHLAADREEAQGGRGLVDRLVADLPGVTAGFTPVLQWGRYRRVASALRHGLDYLRYLDPRFDAAPRIRERARERTPLGVLWLARRLGTRLAGRLLAWLEGGVPPQAGIRQFLEAQRPDVVLITPLVELGSPQLDYIRCAQQMGLRTALCVWSWDHLSSKTLIRILPDRVLVWNDVQRAEAEAFHGVPGDRVLVTGAQCFDHWFDRAPSRTREAFCAALGLPPDRPVLLWVCSALFRGSPQERDLVLRWIAAVRASDDPGLRGASILVRPHPQRADEWTDGLGEAARPGTPDAGVAVLWGGAPVTAGGRDDYFDSLYHAATVVGLNTSALVEAAIVDRPVHTILLPEYRENQEGTFHFHHLLTVGDGCLEASRDLHEHTQKLAATLRGAHGRSNRAFVERFIRPHGLEHAASPAFVDAVEAVGRAARPVAVGTGASAVLARPLVYALTLAARLPLAERLFWNQAKLAAHRAAPGGGPGQGGRHVSTEA